MLCATGLLAGPATAAQRAPAPPPGGGARPLEEVRKEIEGLYRTAERATDEYNAAEEQVQLQQKKIVELARTIDGEQRRLAALKRRAGALASAQYRAGGIPPGAQLALSKDPESFLANADLVRKGQQAVKGVIGQLTQLKTDLEGYAQDASHRWEELEANRKKKDAARKEINDKIDAAKELESRLAAKEKDRLRKLEEDQALLAQQKWLDSGVLKEITGKASEQGKKAISYATSQIGKDYVWGATGPDTFDCSGLTLRAWQAAGRTIPRTSQEQWRQLPRVALKDLRPGDLIIYFSDASHVGMYLGDGAIVHAPRPGRQVTVTGAGTMPILGVVRPDGENSG
ncbi:NlpC/P60 family protein [Streptomyces sp. RS10V-4]|uniref:C40 family peptidase n=1 Tax=Streptomyces rhizoryzae TaxID=2932493 RepID=UPI0020030FA7|nr:C40 family peptidase [Streptomyces rhizoryzae]MCK7624566.1 NlpC/P60 family protein [Streptomyces rhizoryzae]